VRHPSDIHTRYFQGNFKDLYSQTIITHVILNSVAGEMWQSFASDPDDLYESSAFGDDNIPIVDAIESLEHCAKGLLSVLNTADLLQRLAETHNDVAQWNKNTEITYAEILLRVSMDVHAIVVDTYSLEKQRIGSHPVDGVEWSEPLIWIGVARDVVDTPIFRAIRDKHLMHDLLTRCKREILSASDGSVQHTFEGEIPPEHRWGPSNVPTAAVDLFKIKLKGRNGRKNASRQLQTMMKNSAVTFQKAGGNYFYFDKRDAPARRIGTDKDG
jgi:hypothetical protein